MTLLRYALFPALLAVLATSLAWSQAATAPLLVADALPDCRATLARAPDAPLPLLGSESWDCWMLVLTTNLVLLENCDAQQRDEAPPHAHVSGRAARPPNPEAVLQAFVTWAEAHPERGSDLAAAGLIDATTKAYPCRS